MKSPVIKLLPVLVLAMLAGPLLLGQELIERDATAADAPSTEVAGDLAEAPESQPKLENLLSILSAYRSLREKQVNLAERLETLTNEGESAAATAIATAEAELEAVSASIETVKSSIEEVALGLKLDEGEESLAPEPGSLGKELQSLAEPSLAELREIMEPTRRLARLRTEALNLQNRANRLRSSLSKLDAAIEGTQSSELKDDTAIAALFDNIRETLTAQLTLTEVNLSSAKFRLEEMQDQRKPVPQQIREGLSTFFAGRGRSLFLAAVAVIVVFYILTYLHRHLFKRLGRIGVKGSSFGYRLADLGFSAFRFVAAIAAVFLVFLAFDDWLLVTLTILVFLAAIWGAKEALLKGYHKLQLLLNLGPVRQGERVLYNGLPYQVRSLSVYPLLENPSLSNSTIRITIEELGEMRMRYDAEDEPWFVTEVGDYVLLSDGTYGAVAFQSPDRVRIQEAGGQSKVIPTTDFLAMAPTNLSQGYGVAITFGIDYQHQELNYDEVGEAFAEHARRKLEEFLPEGALLATFSAFKEAGASSLDYLVVAKVTGAAQDKRPNLLRALSQGCLDACNENGWGIPFPQITVHRAP